MDVETRQADEEVQRLQRCINDLVSVLALPAIWAGSEVRGIAKTLSRTLVRMLDLDFLCVRLHDSDVERHEQFVEIAPPLKSHINTHAITELMASWSSAGESRHRLQLLNNTSALSELSIIPMQLGLRGEAGLIVAGSLRLNFPSRTERLILDVAANQVLIGLQEARMRKEQKGVAAELDRLVAKRTAELAAANEQLKGEVARRKEAEESVQISKKNLKLIIDTIPALAWTAHLDGSADFFNKHFLQYIGLSEEQARGWGWAAAVHPSDIDALTESWRRIIASGAQGDAEARLCRHDGEYRWFLFRTNPLRNEFGEVVKWYGINTDIEDRKRVRNDSAKASGGSERSSKVPGPVSAFWICKEVSRFAPTGQCRRCSAAVKKNSVKKKLSAI